MATKPTGRPTGRPTKFSPEVAEKIISVLRSGNHDEAAAETAGITVRTFYGWMERGKSDAPAEAGFADFRARVVQARAEGTSRNVALIAQAAAKDWKAAAWLLERQDPEHWARPPARNADDAPHVPITAQDPLDELDARRRKAS